MPGGRKKWCEDCYWEDLLKQRTKINALLIVSPSLRSDYQSFSVWLGESSGCKKAALSSSRHALFFSDVDKRWGSLPSYIELMEFFGVDALRRNRKIIEWLVETKGFFVDKGAKHEFAERSRIQRIVGVGDLSPDSRELLRSYLVELESSFRKKLKTRTIRLYLTAAFSLLKEDNGTSLPTQKCVDKYLAQVPGQRGSLSRFILFINKKYGISLKVSSADDCRSIRKERSKRALIELSKVSWDKNTLEQWIYHGMVYFHGVSSFSQTSMKCIRVDHNEKFISVNWRKSTCYIPIPKAYHLMSSKAFKV